MSMTSYITTTTFLLFSVKAIPIKCFVSHRPTDPFFSKSKKKHKFQIHWSKKQVLCFTGTRSCFNNNWNDVMSLSLKNIDTTFLKAVQTFDSRVNIHLLPSDYISYRLNVRFNIQK